MGRFAFFKAAAALLVYIGAVTFTNRFPYFHDNPMMFSLFGVPLFSYIIYQLLVCTQKRVLRICRTKVVLWAGNISFAFYIAQILSRPLTRILYGYTLEEYVTLAVRKKQDQFAGLSGFSLRVTALIGSSML